VDGVRLRWAVASEREICWAYMGSMEVILRSGGKGVLSMYVISHIINCVSQGFYFSGPETDHSHVGFHSTKL